MVNYSSFDATGELASAFSSGESIEFSGKAIAHLAADPNYLSKSGQILLTGDLVSISQTTSSE
jgi:hypothetical protein